MKKFFLSLLLLIILSTNVRSADFYSAGVDAFKKEQYSQAASNLEHAIRISPKNVNARYYLAQVYIKQNRLSEAKEQYNRIIILAPDSDAAILSQKGLSLIQQAQIIEGTIASSDAYSKYKDNYINYVLPGDGKLYRWKKFPINVYIETHQQKNAVLKAFYEWEQRTDGLVKFNFLNSAKSAQIIVDFQDKLESSSTKKSFISGYSKPYYQNENIMKSEIHILSTNPATGEKIDANNITSSTLHEIGHSLGLRGHSPNLNDVMADSTAENNAKLNLTQRDINTLCMLYKADDKTLLAKTNQQADAKLKQTLEYVKKTPEKAVGWANLGDIYRDKEMYSEAIENYKKAISIEPAKPELYNLLGSAYAGKGDIQNAYTNLKKSCDMDNKNTFYLYQFALFCLKTGYKDIGKSYINQYLTENPEGRSDEKIQNILLLYK